MTNSFKRFIPLGAAAFGIAVAASTASAFALRAPQIAFNVAPLQGYLNSVDPGINVATQQLDAQLWATSVTGNAEFTLMLVSPPNVLGQGAQTLGAVGAALGVYNASAAIPALYQVFPPFAVPGWYAVVNFSGGNLVVTLFNQNSLFQGQTVYPGVNPNNFGFYLQGPGGVLFSQDVRNANGAQMLTFDSPSYPGNYWLCFESLLRTPASTFTGFVFNVQSLRASPASNSTWGRVKGLYR